ncbi:MAG: DUF6335 family protein [Vicinamibacterales bacterium]
MARKKPARPMKSKAATKAKKKAAPKAAARKSPKKAVAKAARKAKKSAKKAVKKVARKAAGIKASATKQARKIVKKAKQLAAGIKAAATKKAAGGKKPNLDRPRKTVADVHGIPSSLGGIAAASSAKSGRAGAKHQLREHTSSSPALTAGDVDADWESADSTGDEAPGGDNPTPDQDVVDEIGRALGVEYADDEELQGGSEIEDRDKHRWELDPSSKDDFEDTE